MLSTGTHSLTYSLTHLTTYSLTQDVIWDDITVEDHLWIIGRLRGCSGNELRESVKNMLVSLGFPEKAKSYAGYSLTHSPNHLLTHSPNHLLTHSGHSLEDRRGGFASG